MEKMHEIWVEGDNVTPNCEKLFRFETFVNSRSLKHCVINTLQCWNPLNAAH